MNVKDYEYIVEIARQKSLSEAANRLCITQSALTKFLQRVEAQLGTPLFNRIGKRFVLTAIGQMYVNKGLEIMRLDQEMEDELAKMRSSSISWRWRMNWRKCVPTEQMPSDSDIPWDRPPLL